MSSPLYFANRSFLIAFSNMNSPRPAPGIVDGLTTVLSVYPGRFLSALDEIFISPYMRRGSLLIGSFMVVLVSFVLLCPSICISLSSHLSGLSMCSSGVVSEHFAFVSFGVCGAAGCIVACLDSVGCVASSSASDSSSVECVASSDSLDSSSSARLLLTRSSRVPSGCVVSLLFDAPPVLAVTCRCWLFEMCLALCVPCWHAPSHLFMTLANLIPHDLSCSAPMRACATV